MERRLDNLVSSGYAGVIVIMTPSDKFDSTYINFILQECKDRGLNMLIDVYHYSADNSSFFDNWERYELVDDCWQKYILRLSREQRIASEKGLKKELSMSELAHIAAEGAEGRRNPYKD